MDQYVERHYETKRESFLRSRRGRLYRPIHKAPVEKAGGRAAQRRLRQLRRNQA